MADESMDVDTFDAADGEIVQGGGGYVDDDIDLDDDDDDEPLVSGTPRQAPPASPALAKSGKRRSSTEPSRQLPGLKKRKKEAPHPNDFLLRAAGTGELRDYVVAKFVTRVPDFADDPHVRLHRNSEATVTGRMTAIEADKKQRIYYNTFSGKRRLQRYAKQGIVTIPDRYRKGWTMEVTPKHVFEARALQAEAEKRAAALNPPTSNGGPDKSSGANAAEESAPNGTEKPLVDPNVDVFAGTFDGKSTSRYAIMVLTEGSKTVDVVPIDEYAWFSFRANRAQGGGVADMTEARMAKVARKGQNRMSKFQVKYEEAQGIREQSMGDNTRIKNSKDYAGFGIRRSRTKQNPEEDDAREDMDFEVEFDNDDVAQVDKESVEKTENRVLGDAEQNAKDFRKMIKDEPITSRPASPGSESDEDPTQRRSPQRSSRSPSPSRPVSASRSPNRSTKSSPAAASRQPTPKGMGSTGMTPFGITPSPSRSPRGNTPQKLDLSHLLPAPGTLPSAQHVTAVLTVLLKNKHRVPFKEVLQYFERKTKEQKDNLTRLLREVAVVTKDVVKPSVYFISWKKSAAPSGLPSGR